MVKPVVFPAGKTFYSKERKKKIRNSGKVILINYFPSPVLESQTQEEKKKENQT